MDGNRIEQKYLYTAVAAAAGVGFLIILILYKKFSANWGGINVFIIAGVLAPIVMIVFSRLRWFQSGWSTPGYIIALVVIGLILNVALGIYFTEQPFYEVRKSEHVNEYRQGDRPGNTFNNIFFLSNFLDGGIDFNIDDESGIVLVILFLVILIILLLIGSFLVPHFWVVSGTILIAILILLALREYAVIVGSEGLRSEGTTSKNVDKVMPDSEIISPKRKKTSSDKAKSKREQTYQKHLKRQMADKEKYFKQ